MVYLKLIRKLLSTNDVTKSLNNSEDINKKEEIDWLSI